MRQIGHLEREEEARVFSDFLYTREIDNEVEPEGGRWVVWVRDEERLERAQQLLAEYRRQPGDAKYRGCAQQAEAKRKQEREEEVSARRRFFGREKVFPERLYRMGALTAVLMAACVGITLLTGFGEHDHFARWFAISPFLIDGGYIRYSTAEQVLRSGEWWRWVTPIFVHMGVVHLLFNLLWLKDLGSLVEQRIGAGRFLVLILLLAVLPNLAEFLSSGPRFGGMSGVVYGLFGFVWIRGKLDPASGFFLDPTTSAIVMAWFFLCWFGVIPNVANIVHSVGLGLGMLAGWVAATAANRR
jgi:GlpG protein